MRRTWHSHSVLWTAALPPLLATALLASTALDRARTALSSAPCWSFHYTQTFKTAGFDEGETFTGKGWLAYPDKMLFERSDGKLVVGLRGRKVRIVDMEALSCQDYTLSEESWSRLPIAMLLSGEAARSYEIEEREGLIAVKAKSDEAAVKMVEIKLQQDGLPLEMNIFEWSGDVNSFSFRHWKRSSPPKGGWLPNPPQGIVCEDMSEAGLEP